MDRPRTSIIVLNYNGAAFIDRCLDAVSAQSGNFETVVVDNQSSDGSADSARRHPDVRVLALEANRGFAGGNNAGAAAARASDYLVFLNNDTSVQPQWLEALVETLDARPDAALATSHIVSLKDPEVVDSAGDGYLWAGGAFKRWHGERRRVGTAVEEVFGACGASFAVRRSVFEALGGFDERFFMVYEDVDLSYRARLLGHRVLYVPASVVQHEGSASLGRASARAVFYGQRNLEWVWLKNSPGSLIWRTAAAHALYSLAGCVYWTARGVGWACVRAKIGAIAGVPHVLAARRRVQASRRIERQDLVPLLVRGWWTLKQREKRAG